MIYKLNNKHIGSYTEIDTISKNKKTTYPFIRYKQGGILKAQLGLKEEAPIQRDNTSVVQHPKPEVAKEPVDSNWRENTDNVKYNPYNDKYVREFFDNDVLPRYIRENPNATQEQIEAVRNAYTDPQNFYYEDWDKNNNITGGFAKDTEHGWLYGIPMHKFYKQSAAYNSKLKLSRPTLVHENTHLYRQGNLGNVVKKDPYPYIWGIPPFLGRNGGSGYSSEEGKRLLDTYNLTNYNEFQDLNKNNLKHKNVIEAGTTNAEVRYRLWKELYDKNGKMPTIDELDDYIRNYDGSKLWNIVGESNRYGAKALENKNTDAFFNIINPNNESFTPDEEQKIREEKSEEIRLKQEEWDNKLKDTLIHVADNRTNENLPENTAYSKEGGILNNMIRPQWTYKIVKASNGTKTYNHNDYYGYINKIQEQAIKNPEWFWSDAADATEARQWLYNNGASEIVDTIYNETPQELQKRIDPSKLSKASGQKQFNKGITDATNNIARTGAAIAGTAAMIPAAVAAPVTTAAGVVGSIVGSKVGKNIGEHVNSNRLDENGNSIISTRANEGELIGGTAGAIAGAGAVAAVKNSGPGVVRQIEKEVQDTYFGPDSNNIRREAIRTRPRYKVNSLTNNRNAKYKDVGDVIEGPLFPKKGTVAHEYGHHIASNLGGNYANGTHSENVFGIIPPDDYMYIPGNSYKTKMDEAFADYVAERTGHPVDEVFKKNWLVQERAKQIRKLNPNEVTMEWANPYEFDVTK